MNIDDPRIPLIKPKPAPGQIQHRIQKIPIANLVLNDPIGAAELKPQDDLTLVELYKLTLLMAWILGTPPNPVPDPMTQGKTGLVMALQWRQYIDDEELGRHFEYRMRADTKTEGSA